ncbi:hypothetical protein E4T47_08285 [Aureobasidium subglaciale]|nr:hypothetical protein E4T47_08285 [Aureobasidium subglaciale]
MRPKPPVLITATTSYTDSCGQQYTVYCSADSQPGSYSQVNNVDSFANCMAYCSNTQGVCNAVTYVGTTCYLKRSFSSLVRPSNGNTAVVYVPTPNYPPPVADGAFRSTGCGRAVGAGVNPGGSSTQFTGTGPDGYLHTYNLRVPSTYDPTKAAPLIVGFHGRGDSGANFESASGWSVERINPYGITVYPTGIRDSENQNTWLGDPSWVNNATVNDMTFVQALVANISSQYCVDTSRVFAVGMSNGGGFVNVMACDPVMSTIFTAFGPHSGAFYTKTGDANTPRKTEPID